MAASLDHMDESSEEGDEADRLAGTIADALKAKLGGQYCPKRPRTTLIDRITRVTGS